MATQTMPELSPAPASGMDVPRPPRRRWPRRLLAGGAGLGALGLAIALARAPAAAPSVDRDAVWVGGVARGAMVRQVRGSGTLAPVDVRWITAASPGRVERVPLLPGVVVDPDTVLVELGNPELRQAALELDAQMRAAEAQRDRLRLQLEGDRLAQEALVAALRSELAVTRIEADGDEQLHASGTGAALTARRSRAKADELAGRIQIEARRLEVLGRSARAQLVVQDVEVERLRAARDLRRDQVEALRVRAGMRGVLQRLGDERPLRIGEHVAAGAPLARIADPTALKAEIAIPETLAKDVRLGLPATVDTRNGLVAGRVARIDPAVQNGTVTIDVALGAPLPDGARPGLGVEGLVTLERLGDVLHVGRPAGVQAPGAARLFKLIDGGRGAVRVPVRVGRMSTDAMEVLAGLADGDEIILSDVSSWDGHDRIRLR